MADEFSVVGKRLPRVDAVTKVKGEATYVPDMQLPGMLHAKFLRSPHPRARIVKINTKEAESLPGVRGVLTHKNVPKVHPRFKLEYLLNETLRYAGDEVAMVAAETKEIAEEALKLKRPYMLCSSSLTSGTISTYCLTGTSSPSTFMARLHFGEMTTMPTRFFEPEQTMPWLTFRQLM